MISQKKKQEKRNLISWFLECNFFFINNNLINVIYFIYFKSIKKKIVLYKVFHDKF